MLTHSLEFVHLAKSSKAKEGRKSLNDLFTGMFRGNEGVFGIGFLGMSRG